MRTPTDCPHEQVCITRIIQPRTVAMNGPKERILGGHCEKCGGPVHRIQTPEEFETGIPASWWRLGDGIRLS